MSDRYVFLNDRETFTDLEGCTVIEYGDRDRGAFEGFYRHALDDGDGHTVYANGDRMLFLGELFAGLTFVEIGAALDAARTAKVTA